MRQCDGVWHFPWSRNACGIYSFHWLYIPNNCMLSSVLIYCHFCWKQVLERGPVTSLRRCSCQISAMTLLFSSVALYSPLNCWHFGIRQPSLCTVSSMLLPASLTEAECGGWTAMLPPKGTFWYSSLAHCSFTEGLCQLKTPLNVARTDFYSLLDNRWSAINGYKRMLTWPQCSLGRMIHFKIKSCFCESDY